MHDIGVEPQKSKRNAYYARFVIAVILIGLSDRPTVRTSW